MFTLTRRVVAAFLLVFGASAVMGQPVARGCDQSPLSHETIVMKNFEGKATVEFTVGEACLMPSSWTTAAFKSAPLLIVPKATGEKFQGQVSVIVSRETANRLKQLGIEDPDVYFRGKVLRVSGTVEGFLHRSGKDYCIQVNSLDQIEAIRKP
jgi:hypothetical protein